MILTYKKNTYRNNLKVPNAENQKLQKAFKAQTLVSFCDLAVFCLSWLRISARRLCTCGFPKFRMYSASSASNIQLIQLAHQHVVKIKRNNILLHLAALNDISETYYHQIHRKPLRYDFGAHRRKLELPDGIQPW